jgi:hypothetical protein
MRWWWASRALDDLGWRAHRRRIEEADAHLDASEARARDAREALEAAVVSAWTGLKAAQRAVEAGKARSAAADEALRSTRLEAKWAPNPRWPCWMPRARRLQPKPPPSRRRANACWRPGG